MEGNTLLFNDRIFTLHHRTAYLFKFDATMPTSPATRRSTVLLSLSFFVLFFSTIPSKVSAQQSDDGSWRYEEHWYNLQMEAFRYPGRSELPPNLWAKFDQQYFAKLNEPYLEKAFRLGALAGGGINFHDAAFNLPGYFLESQTRIFNTTVSPSSTTFTTPSVSLGIAAELPLTEIFAIGLRLYQSTQSASLVMKTYSFSSKFDVSLTTLTSEALAIFTLGEHWRTYLGFAFSGLIGRQYSFPNSTANSYSSPASDILESTNLVVSPLVGVGYDIFLTTPKSPFGGRWVLTPEVMGMVGLNQFLGNLSSQERWSLSQLRFGINISYQWHGNKPTIIP